MCLDRNINGNTDIKFLGCDYWLVQRCVNLTLVTHGGFLKWHDPQLNKAGLRTKMCSKLLIFIFLGLIGPSLALEGNEFCTTDKKFAGYNHLFFPNLDKFTFR